MSRSAIIAVVALVGLGAIFFASQEKDISVGVQTLKFEGVQTATVEKIEVKGKNPDV